VPFDENRFADGFAQTGDIDVRGHREGILVAVEPGVIFLAS
jgi:hypothetical protein